MPADPYCRLPRQLAEALKRTGVSGRLLLAVSGGADSMAMLRASAAIAGKISIDLVVGHLDHAVRAESCDDANWVAEQAGDLGLDCKIARIDVAAEAARRGRGIEETARRVRYEWLAAAARDAGAASVATAHTANDSAETILFHLLRGTGLAGCRGIAPSRKLTAKVRLVRPMLSVSRDDVLAYLTEIGQQFREDPTNADLGHTRNRIRHQILPELRESINPRLDQALVRLAEQSRETQALLARIARRELKQSLIEMGPERIRLDIWDLGARRAIIVRETLRLAWRRAGWPRQAMSAAHWDALATLVREGGRRTLPGDIDAHASGGELVITRAAGREE